MPEELITITGIEEVQQMLKEAPREVVAGGFLKALQAGANVIKTEVAARTPVDTGNMRSALLSEITIDADFRGGMAEIGFGKEGHKANFVEYGHRMIGHKPSKKDEGMVQPHPFMRPAAAVAADAAIEAFAETLVDELKGGLLDGA